jgi:predicted amidophosphoribosyltransferase
MLSAMARQALASLAAIVAPPRCAICALACRPRQLLCPACARSLEEAVPLLADPGPPGVEVALAASAYEGAARSLVTGLKFARRLPLATCAAAAIAAAGERHGLLHGALVPVPPDPLRLRARGFDPAEEIAAALAESSGLRLDRCLERAPAPRQVGRSRRRRTTSRLRVDAWRAPPPRVVLVDDVWTTGATLVACAMALREAGSERVVAVTLAHATRSLATAVGRA